MKEIISIYKKLGETPLECLNRLRLEKPDYKEAVLSYAGRLDPMAEGVLLVLVGEENKNREKYLSLSKTYIVEILWGIETDTYDLLGRVSSEKELHCHSLQELYTFHILDYQNVQGLAKVLWHFLTRADGNPCLVNTGLDPRLRGNDPDSKLPDIEKLSSVLKTFVGKYKQKYPPYSSKTVGGIPLWKWSRDGKLGEIEIPEKEVEVYSAKVLGEETILKKNLEEKIIEKIQMVSGDFRQKEITKNWQDFFADTKRKDFLISKIEIGCGSGVYMRSLAHALGEKFGCGAVAYSIKRTRVGEEQYKGLV